MGNRRSWPYIVWSIVYVLLLLSLLTPALLLTMSFLMVPVLVLYVKLDTKRFALFYVLSLAAVYALTAWTGPMLVSISLFFLPPVIVMGNLYKKKAPGKTALTAGTVTLLAETLLTLLIGYALGFDPISKFHSFMLEYVNALPTAVMGMMQVTPEQYVSMLIQIIPLELILFAYYYAVVNHAVARRILNRMGEALPGVKPLREWRLPKTFVWLYIAAFLFDLVLPASDRSMMSTLLMNLLPLLLLAFTLQALSFLFFIAHEQHRTKALPIVAIVILVLMFPLLIFIYSLLGVLDAAMPIRERFRKNG
ncbi:hypothetical protein SD70_18980 [Gordoniibacillus kamchatkensis]|uniref:DUF2232 domain-containing protein n=1 Tax=Gordoniibacillus kamchatkensis TaxID=1590651 RepID=A0ABR5AEX4_9BACL|nr:DUF2232 domain-containing protein [Paenibacillus sp. VKM B-2647]KIL39611.1 hypothetical protein SD70_18980 [Paenibacillus sp. VKM B-2647]